MLDITLKLLHVFVFSDYSSYTEWLQDENMEEEEDEIEEVGLLCVLNVQK